MYDLTMRSCLHEAEIYSDPHGDDYKDNNPEPDRPHIRQMYLLAQKLYHLHPLISLYTSIQFPAARRSRIIGCCSIV